MIKEILYVGAGSFVGGVLRYLVSQAIKYDGGFPWATFIVNILGCLMIGLIAAWSMRLSGSSREMVPLLSAGLCGGFTTFSTFSKESFVLLQTGNFTMFALYIILSIALGIAMVGLGYYIAK